MTSEQIREYEKQLLDILDSAARRTPGSRETLKKLRDLAPRVGASIHSMAKNDPCGQANVAELAQNIHQALQTLSMIDACRTATRNFEIAREAQRLARTSQWVAVAAMLAAVAAATAPWIWH